MGLATSTVELVSFDSGSRDGFRNLVALCLEKGKLSLECIELSLVRKSEIDQAAIILEGAAKAREFR